MSLSRRRKIAKGSTMRPEDSRARIPLVRRLLLGLTLLLGVGCDDPQPGRIGGLLFVIRTFESAPGSRLEEASAVAITYSRVEALHSALNGSDSRVVLDAQDRTIVLNNEPGDVFVAQFQVPVGEVSQLRFFPKAVELLLRDGTRLALDPDSSDCRVGRTQDGRWCCVARPQDRLVAPRLARRVWAEPFRRPVPGASPYAGTAERRNSLARFGGFSPALWR